MSTMLLKLYTCTDNGVAVSKHLRCLNAWFMVKMSEHIHFPSIMQVNANEMHE